MNHVFAKAIFLDYSKIIPPLFLTPAMAEGEKTLRRLEAFCKPSELIEKIAIHILSTLYVFEYSFKKTSFQGFSQGLSGHTLSLFSEPHLQKLFMTFNIFGQLEKVRIFKIIQLEFLLFNSSSLAFSLFSLYFIIRSRKKPRSTFSSML